MNTTVCQSPPKNFLVENVSSVLSIPKTHFARTRHGLERHKFAARCRSRKAGFSFCHNARKIFFAMLVSVL